MKQLYKIIVALLIVVVMGVSCERKDLLLECVCQLEARLPIRINWEQLDTPPQNVTVLFYDQTTGALAHTHTYEHNDQEVHSYAGLREGIFTAVVVNEIALRDGQLKNIEAKGSDKLSTLEFVLSEAQPLVTRQDTDLGYVGQPDQLAVLVVEDIEIDHNIIHIMAGDILPEKYSGTDAAVQSHKLLDITPELKTYTLDLSIHVQNLEDSRMNVLSEIHHIASSYYPHGDRNSTTSVRQQFEIGDPVYDAPRSRDGTISVRITSLGALGVRGTMADQPDNASNSLSVNALYMLVDHTDTHESIEDREYPNLGSSVEYLMFPSATQIRNHVRIHIADQEPLPDVIPEGETAAGWGSDVTDWDVIEIPL